MTALSKGLAHTPASACMTVVGCVPAMDGDGDTAAAGAAADGRAAAEGEGVCPCTSLLVEGCTDMFRRVRTAGATTNDTVRWCVRWQVPRQRSGCGRGGVRKVREVRRCGNRVGDQTDHGASDGDVGEELRCLETCELACVQLRGEGKRGGRGKR